MSGSSTALEAGISMLLRIGVLVSVSLESAGLLLYYAQTGDSSVNLADSSWRIGSNNFFGFASSTLGGFLAGPDPSNIVGLGIAVLVLTPWVRILAAVAYYALKRDFRYLSITLFVFVVITTALILL